MTTHGQPAVAHNGNSTSAAAAESGPKTVASAAPTPPADNPADAMTAAQAAAATTPSDPETDPGQPEPEAERAPRRKVPAGSADSRDREEKVGPATHKSFGIKPKAGVDQPDGARTDAEAEAVPEPAPTLAARAVPRPRSKPETAPEADPDREPESAAQTDPAAEPGPESQPEAEAKPEPRPEARAAAQAQPEAQQEAEAPVGTDARPGPDARPEPDAAPAAATEMPAGEVQPLPHGYEERDPALDVLAVPGHIGDLALTLRKLRTEIVSSRYPLELPSTEEARRTSAAVVAQIDDYLLPRLARLDAPLLVVVGGSTGAGKSTLVNSLVRTAVSPAGVLRPTTRAPVLVSHPADTAWFRQGRLLPGLTRTTKPGDDPHTLRLVAAPALTPGLALVDAPDIDSVVSTNRQLAAQLLSAADLWLFVTTAARYADAVPWDMLQTAAYRGTVVALVLDRVPPDAAAEVIPHLTDLLGAHRFSGVPLFVLPETTLDGQGLLAEDVVAPIGAWLAGLAGDPTARSAVTRQTVDGALATIEPIVAGLAEAAEDQVSATMSLTDRTGAAYRSARLRVEHALLDGTLMRGGLLARWQEFVDTGELAQAQEARHDRVRDQMVAAVTGRSTPGKALRAALASALVALVRAAAADGTEQAYAGWQAHPSGAALLRPDLARPGADLAQRAERLVREWQQGVYHLASAATHDGSSAARGTAYAMNATNVLVMAGIVASAALGDQTIRTLSRKARDDLLARVDALLDAEAGRFLRLLPTYGLGMSPADRLRVAGEQVERARRGARLTAGAGPVELALPAAARPSEEEG